jgi:hypothetical protein
MVGGTMFIWANSEQLVDIEKALLIKVNEDYTSGEAYIPGLDKPVQLNSTTALEFVKGFHNMRPGKDGKVPVLPPPPVLPAVEN